MRSIKAESAIFVTNIWKHYMKRLWKSYSGIVVSIVLFAVATVIDARWNQSGFKWSVASGFSPILWIIIATASLVGLFVSLALIFGKFARLLYVCWFTWVLLYFSLSYGLKEGFQRSLDGEILQIVFSTNAYEAWSFIRETCSVSVVLSLVGVLGALVLGICLLWRCRYPMPNLARILCGIVLVVAFFLCNVVLLHPVKAATRVGYFYWPVMAGVEYCRLKTLVHSLEKTELPEVVELRKTAAPVVGVFVIGESATRRRFGLYDRRRKTTPRLETLRGGELFVFSDLVGAAAGTVSAIRLLTTSTMLDGSEPAAMSLYSLLKRTGCPCPYIVNNAYDRPQGMLGLLFRDCSDIDIVGGGGYATLLPHVRRAIDSCRGKGGVVTVNGRGSHFPFDKIAPRLPGAPEDAYDSTIYYLDGFLSEIVGMLRETHLPAFLIYVSDHGESPDATIWRCLSDVATWELPFFVWTSDEYKAAFPDIVEAMRMAREKPIQSDQLFFGLTRIMGLVSPPRYSAELDFLSPSFVPRKERPVQYGQTTYEKMKGSQR